MAIGGLLGGVAAFLVTKNREMLVGRSVPRESLQAVEQALLNDKIVRTVYGTKGVVMGSDQVCDGGRFLFANEVGHAS